MAALHNPCDHVACRVRGCPIILPEIKFSEWGADGFLIASHFSPATIPQHEHFPLQISLPLRGSWVHSFGKVRSEILTPGTAAFIPSGEKHGTRGLGAGELITINAELSWCEEHCDVALPILRAAKLDTTNAQALESILNSASLLLQSAEMDELYIASIGLTTTLGILHSLGLHRRRNMSVQFSGPLRAVTRWIEDHLDEKITLAQLATLAQCSQWHLIRVFNSTLGVSPAR